MTSRNRRDDWLDDDEYPSDDDVERFGEDSPSAARRGSRCRDADSLLSSAISGDRTRGTLR